MWCEEEKGKKTTMEIKRHSGHKCLGSHDARSSMCDYEHEGDGEVVDVC